jgi:hypothetical protein
MYIVYAQIEFSTNRQTFNKNIATTEKISDFYIAQIIIRNLCLQCQIKKQMKYDNKSRFF